MNKDNQKIKLEDLGYSEFFKNKRAEASCSDFIPARITAGHKGSYILRNEWSEFSGEISGKMMFYASSGEEYPAVGDWVLISVLDEKQAIIHEILPRKTVLKRKSAGKTEVQVIAANIDAAFIIQSPDRDYSLNRFERYFALAESEKIKPAIVLNKTDRIDPGDLKMKISEIKERFQDTDIYATSTVTGSGMDELKKDIKKGLTYCLLGSSGVGKSSIINTLAGRELIKTGEISSYSDRGKHITTRRQLFILENGGLLIDNPGMREVGLLDSDAGIRSVFSDIQDLSRNCRFSDCTHTHEPGCAVLEALESGDLDESRYENYIKLAKENEYHTMTKLDKREKDRRFGKHIKQVMKDIKKYKA